MFGIGLGVIVVAGKVRNKEIAVSDFLIALRCQSSLDRGKARVRDGPGGQAGAGVGLSLIHILKGRNEGGGDSEKETT